MELKDATIGSNLPSPGNVLLEMDPEPLEDLWGEKNSSSEKKPSTLSPCWRGLRRGGSGRSSGEPTDPPSMAPSALAKLPK